MKQNAYAEKSDSNIVVNWFIVSSVLMGLLYIGVVIWVRAIDWFQPESILDIFKAYGYLSIPLVIPALIIGVSIFGRILRQNGRLLGVSLAALLFTAMIWLVFALVLAFASDRLAPVKLDFFG